jgi:2-polyprenyl-3-methyl-5-hydroxy-6-metoxy-1,4-benzoquinol methylase
MGAILPPCGLDIPSCVEGHVKLKSRFFSDEALLLWAALLFLVASSVPILSQTPAEVEARIGNLPPDQRAYERFRYWITTLSPDQQPTSEDQAFARYRAYLKASGFSDADADSQIKLVREQSARLEVERWNRILTAENPTFNTKPNEFLIQIAKDRKPGTALDVGMGQGRNAIWLAQQGWDVTGFDPAERAVALAQATAKKLNLTLKTEIKGMEEFDFGDRRWDLILLSYVGARGMQTKLERALKPGGVLVIEGFHRDATKGRSIGGAVVFDTGELPKLYSNLRVVRYEEPIGIADFGGQDVLRVVRYCGEKVE